MWTALFFPSENRKAKCAEDGPKWRESNTLFQNGIKLAQQHWRDTELSRLSATLLYYRRQWMRNDVWQFFIRHKVRKDIEIQTMTRWGVITLALLSEGTTILTSIHDMKQLHWVIFQILTLKRYRKQMNHKHPCLRPWHIIQRTCKTTAIYIWSNSTRLRWREYILRMMLPRKLLSYRWSVKSQKTTKRRRTLKKSTIPRNASW